MKRVSFEVAKTLKEVGYPQDRKDVGYVTEKCTDRFNVYHEGELTDNASRMIKKFSAPYVMEVWLWLWREKKLCINCNYDKYNLLPMWWCNNEDGINYNTPNFNDPEEAIIGAIEHIVTNKLIK